MDHSHHHHAHDHAPKHTGHAHHNMDHANHNMDHGSHDAHPVYEVVTKAMTSLMSTVMSTVMPTHDHHDHNMHVAHDTHDSHSTHGGHDTHSVHSSHGDHGSHAGHGSHGSHGSHGLLGAHGHHSAFFHNKYDMAVLFEEWTIDTKTGIFLVFLFTAILSICYQGIKWSRAYLHNHYRERKHTWKSKEHIVQTILYAAEFFASYILMLVVMTYNIWVLVITIVGLGLGYFLFGLHQATECARDCPNVLVDERNKNYDKNPSAAELMPLGNGVDTCEGCCTSEFTTVRETDILT